MVTGREWEEYWASVELPDKKAVPVMDVSNHPLYGLLTDWGVVEIVHFERRLQNEARTRRDN